MAGDRFCPGCGRRKRLEDAYCRQCGLRLEPSPEASNEDEEPEPVTVPTGVGAQPPWAAIVEVVGFVLFLGSALLALVAYDTMQAISNSTPAQWADGLSFIGQSIGLGRVGDFIDPRYGGAYSAAKSQFVLGLAGVVFGLVIGYTGHSTRGT